MFISTYHNDPEKKVEESNKQHTVDPKMHEEQLMQQGLSGIGFSPNVSNLTPAFSSVGGLTFHQSSPQAAAAMEIELQQHMGFHINNPLVEEIISDVSNLFHLPNSSFSYTDQVQNPTSFLPTVGFLGAGDLISPNIDSALASSGVNYDPLFSLNLQQQPPLFRELMSQSPLPNGYTLNCGLLLDERDGSAGGNQFDGEERKFYNGGFDFIENRKCMGRRRDGKGTTRQLNTEKQKRGQLSDQYKILSFLVPNPTKADRASVVGDAIEYIKELLRTVNDLLMLVERKRCSRERIKRHKTENDGPDPDHSYNGLRSSWLQRKFKDSEIDVRFVDDEVTIKFAHPKKKINCLLPVSKALDELQLDIQHVAGGLVGDSCSFLFNSKICEGSSVYACAIANKIMKVTQQFQPNSSSILPEKKVFNEVRQPYIVPKKEFEAAAARSCMSINVLNKLRF